MSGPNSATQLVITMVSGVSGGPFTLPIPASIVGIGLAPADAFIRDIFVRGGFWDPAAGGKFYTVFQIASIDAS